MREALELALARQSHESAARAFTNLADMLYVYADMPALAELVHRGREFCAERGLTQFAVLLDLHRQHVLLHDGAWDVAEPGLHKLHEQARNTRVFEPRVAAAHARLLARRGREHEAELVEAMVLDAWAEACRQRQPVAMLYTALAATEWAWLADRPAVAEEVQEIILPRLTSVAWNVRRDELLRFAALAAGRAPSGEPARRLPAGAAPGLVGRHRADDRRLAAAGRAGRARTGPAGAASAARAGLPGCRARPRPPPAGPNPLGLTDRQADVLELLVSGATNAEIAERLLLSVRTVDHHVPPS